MKKSPLDRYRDADRAYTNALKSGERNPGRLQHLSDIAEERRQEWVRWEEEWEARGKEGGLRAL